MRSNRYYAAAVIWNRKEKTRALIEDREPVLRPENPAEEEAMRRKAIDSIPFPAFGNGNVPVYKHSTVWTSLMEERPGKQGKGGKRKWGFNREHK
ncbi:hypothetical protein VPHD472_0074 [Vibrio phage D472]